MIESPRMLPDEVAPTVIHVIVVQHAGHMIHSLPWISFISLPFARKRPLRLPQPVYS